MVFPTQGFDGTHCERDVDECEVAMPCDDSGTDFCEDLVIFRRIKFDIT
jgi:hypothetical protein